MWQADRSSDIDVHREVPHSSNRRMPLEEINGWLQSFGRNGVTLDAYTFRLISAMFDVEMESRGA